MRIVVDTNFLVSATQWDYSVSHKLLILLIKNDHKLFSTKEILQEFANVLKRDFLYDEDETNHIIENVLKFLILVIPKQKVEIIKEDLDDNKILECGLEACADFIVSYDKHLLV